jgi:putative hydrolase of the HAD superfamily
MKKLIIFIDSGDTLIDESTQVFDDRGIVKEAEFIEGAKRLLEQLKEEEFRVCLVADGEWESFENVFGKNGMRHVFEGWTISEKIGIQKPEKAMFDNAMKVMNLSKKDKNRVVMIGNNLKKDIAGANRYGVTSIWMDWSPRYFHDIQEEDWAPDYVVHRPEDIMQILKNLEEAIQSK